MNPPALAMEFVERQPAPRPLYESSPPRVIKVYEQPLRDYPTQPRPQPVPFTPQTVSAPQPPRVDPPQQIVGTWVAERKRWNAEEFEGELDDQVRRQQRLARAAAAAEAAAAQAANTNLSYQQPVVVQSTYVPQAPQQVAGVTELPMAARYSTGVTSYATGTTPAARSFTRSAANRANSPAAAASFAARARSASSKITTLRKSIRRTPNYKVTRIPNRANGFGITMPRLMIKVARA